MGHKYVVGQKVRATNVEQNFVGCEGHLVRPGDIGRVVDCPDSDGPCIEWAPGEVRHGYARDPSKLELFDALAATAGLAGIRVTQDMIQQRASDARMQQMANAVYQQAAQQQGQGGLGQVTAAERQEDILRILRELGVCGENPAETFQRLLDERQILRGRIEEMTEGKQVVGDVCGERDRLRAKVAELETDVAFYRRECVRLGGRARGGR